MTDERPANPVGATGSTDTNANDKAALAVGRLILSATILDNQLNSICIEALALAKSPLLEPVVATIDPARKIEMMKARARQITAGHWKKPIMKYLEAVEAVNRMRNIAAHSLLGFNEDGSPMLYPLAMAKMLKGMDLTRRTMERTEMSAIEEAYDLALDAFTRGEVVRSNLERFNEERLFRTSPAGIIDSAATD